MGAVSGTVVRLVQLVAVHTRIMMRKRRTADGRVTVDWPAPMTGYYDLSNFLARSFTRDEGLRVTVFSFSPSFSAALPVSLLSPSLASPSLVVLAVLAPAAAAPAASCPAPPAGATESEPEVEPEEVLGLVLPVSAASLLPPAEAVAPLLLDALSPAPPAAATVEAVAASA